jgi:ABC-type phosphate transport system ATPase subunit
LGIKAKYLENIRANGVGLSRGQNKRLIIAIALSKLPSKFYLKGYGAALDEKTAETVRIKIKEFCVKNKIEVEIYD